MLKRCLFTSLQEKIAKGNTKISVFIVRLPVICQFEKPQGIIYFKHEPVIDDKGSHEIGAKVEPVKLILSISKFYVFFLSVLVPPVVVVAFVLPPMANPA